jgi:hypothetical protein
LVSVLHGQWWQSHPPRDGDSDEDEDEEQGAQVEAAGERTLSRSKVTAHRNRCLTTNCYGHVVTDDDGSDEEEDDDESEEDEDEDEDDGEEESEEEEVVVRQTRSTRGRK